MGLLVLFALVWLVLRSLLLISQVARHTPEAQLARSFEEELRDRGYRLDGTRMDGDS